MSDTVLPLKIFAPAKINLHLAVKDKLPNGFHNLESIFLSLDFGDTLNFEIDANEKNVMEIIMEGSASTDFDFPIEENIIFKAVSLFREKTGFNLGLKITVEKRIPLGGGLGGGSSDAAASLLALNRLSGGVLSKDALLELAASLGSDVPFFIHETAAAYVTGRGENILPIKAPDCSIVLVNPGFHSDTAAAFRLLDLAREKIVKKKLLKEKEDDFFYSASPENLFCRPGEINFKSFFNDFISVFNEPEKSVYLSIISQLQELGADYANLSGTGSTCFGVFKEETQAEKAAAELRCKWGFVKCCFLK